MKCQTHWHFSNSFTHNANSQLTVNSFKTLEETECPAQGYVSRLHRIQQPLLYHNPTKVCLNPMPPSPLFTVHFNQQKQWWKKLNLKAKIWLKCLSKCLSCYLFLVYLLVFLQSHLQFSNNYSFKYSMKAKLVTLGWWIWKLNLQKHLLLVLIFCNYVKTICSKNPFPGKTAQNLRLYIFKTMLHLHHFPIGQSLGKATTLQQIS